MSTRATYTFKGTSEYDHDMHIYKHHDGYPKGGLNFIHNALQGPRAFNRYQDAQLTRDQAVLNFFICNNYESISFTSHYESHGDLEYRYEIKKTGKDQTNLNNWTIKVYKLDYGPDKFENEKLIFDGTYGDSQDYLMTL
jgi:hypothetical protein